jgi:hypothetical protein
MAAPAGLDILPGDQFTSYRLNVGQIRGIINFNFCSKKFLATLLNAKTVLYLTE